MQNRNLFIQDLKLNLEGDVLADDFSLGMYATDASLYQILPIAIALPKSEVDVSAALKIASDYQVTILPRGGGTSLAGQTVGKSLILDFSKYLNNILEINEEDQWAIVQPGLVRDELNEALSKYKLHYAPDPATSSRANVGGMIGNNSSGTKSILYGKTVDHLLELKIALADGTILKLKPLSAGEYRLKEKVEGIEGEIYRRFRSIIENNKEAIEKRFPKVLRRVQGYNLDEFVGRDIWNLSKLICGSEGTLAVILEAKINLEPLPRFKSICVAHFNDFLETIRAVETMLEFNPSAVEILDKNVLEHARTNLTTQRLCHFIEGNPAAILLVEFYSDSKVDVIERPTKMAKKLIKLGMGYAHPIFEDAQSMSDVWTVRKKGLGLMLGMTGRKKPLAFIEDAAIPIRFLPEYIERVLAICKKYETEAAAYAHASVGVIHVRPILDMRDGIDIERLKKITEETFELVIEYGGSWSGEHGDGLVRSYYLERFFGGQVYKALREVKKLFDPENRMNPGKIIDAQKIDENLRYGTEYREEKVATYFKFKKEGSFENSVHLCNGVGECRKTQGGTMCPSYRATKEEEHSTRGRANALRLAMSGQLGEGLSDPRLSEALDLCLSCKACKSECPSNVDMAKLKSEVLQKRHEEKGLSLREKFIRDASNFSALFSGKRAALINRIQRLSFFRWNLDRMIGIERRRTLPDYAIEPFHLWYKKRYPSNPGNPNKVVLFADTYLNFHEPNIGIAATQLLQKCGYEVILANVGCCQRPRISNGFLKLAKEEGTQTANKLDKWMKQGLKILVCEPSCATALSDDLPDLIEDEALAKRLINQVMMIDIFLEKEIDSGKLEVDFEIPFKKVLVHGHCQQKAIFGTKAMNQLLSNCGNSEIEEIDSGCCGMAGSFGYEKEHYKISEKIGDLALFPKLRESAADTEIVACGFSCRHQIEHFTGRKAKHLVEILTTKS